MDYARNSEQDKSLTEMIEKGESAEAGVAELAALYERIEAIYIEASQTLASAPPTLVSNAANPRR